MQILGDIFASAVFHPFVNIQISSLLNDDFSPTKVRLRASYRIDEHSIRVGRGTISPGMCWMVFRPVFACAGWCRCDTTVVSL